MQKKKKKKSEKFNELCMWLMSIWQPFAWPVWPSALRFALLLPSSLSVSREIWPSVGLRTYTKTYIYVHTYINVYMAGRLLRRLPQSHLMLQSALPFEPAAALPCLFLALC